MSTAITQSPKPIKQYFWIFFIIVGLLHLGLAVNSFCILCQEPSRLDWLTRDPEILDYLLLVWRLVGLFELGLSLVMMIIAATGYRRRQKWAWHLLWLWLPILIGETILMYWLLPFLAPLIALVLIGQLWVRSLFIGETEHVS